MAGTQQANAMLATLLNRRSSCARRTADSGRPGRVRVHVAIRRERAIVDVPERRSAVSPSSVSERKSAVAHGALMQWSEKGARQWQAHRGAADRGWA
jgi:hypothetical protein